MASFSHNVRRLFKEVQKKWSALAIVVAGLGLTWTGLSLAASCASPVYLTLDTGNMRHAELIAEILKKHQIKVSFFLANEKTFRGDFALDESWSAYWKARANEGHIFGSHTFDHVYFKGLATKRTKTSQGTETRQFLVRPQFGAKAGQNLVWNEGQVCEELKRVNRRFELLAQKSLAAIWRAPGGKAPQEVFDAMKACGYRHVYWAQAGFLGDELPSQQFPNQLLLSRALEGIQAGDILMAHLGIWSRQDPFAPMLDPLIVGLKAKGFCFEVLP